MNCRQDRFPFLSKYSKEIIIEYLEKECFHPIKEHEIIFVQWDNLSEKCSTARKEHIEKNSVISELAKQCDALSLKINSEKDFQKKILMFNEYDTMIKKIQKHHSNWKHIDTEQEKADELYQRATNMSKEYNEKVRKKGR